MPDLARIEVIGSSGKKLGVMTPHVFSGVGVVEFTTAILTPYADPPSAEEKRLSERVHSSPPTSTAIGRQES